MKRILFALLVAIVAGCTTSGVIMTGGARPARSATEVKVFLRPPVKFESIALVTAKSNAAMSREGNRENVVAELQRKAAELGANGILLNPNETGPSTTTSAVYIPGARGAPGFFVGGGAPGITIEMQAEAIWVLE